jgi:hypothetical protein
LVEALQCVLHQEYSVELKRLESLPEMLRVAVTPEMAEDWDVMTRIRKWEESHGRRVLR